MNQPKPKGIAVHSIPIPVDAHGMPLAQIAIRTIDGALKPLTEDLLRQIVREEISKAQGSDTR